MPHRQTPIRPLLAGALLLLAWTAPARACAPVRTPMPRDVAMLVRSQLAEADGDAAMAIAAAESLTVAEPASSFACSRLASLHEAAGQDASALRWGDRALARDSVNVDAAMLVARMRLRSGESEIAAQVLTPPLRQLGAPPEAYALRALAHELSRRYDAALADLKRTGELLPDFAWIATAILGLALEDGRLEEAGEALALALDLRPGDARVLRLGAALGRKRGDASLEGTLLRALAMSREARPTDLAAYGAFLGRTGRAKSLGAFLGWAERSGAMPARDLRIETGDRLVREGHYREALAAVRPIERDPRAAPVRARAFVSLGEDRKALDCYRRFLPERWLSREESLVVAYLEIRVGERGRGIETLERARAAGLDSPRQVLAASLCYSLLGYPDEAVALIRHSAARGVSSPSVLEELGSAASVLGDTLVAQWAFERMRDLGKETSECLYYLGSAELSQGRRGHALATLQRAVRLDPRNGRALYLIGTLRSEQGQLELALDALRAAAGCPEVAKEANRALAKVCRALKLEAEARVAEARARASRPAQPAGLTLFQSR